MKKSTYNFLRLPLIIAVFAIVGLITAAVPEQWLMPLPEVSSVVVPDTNNPLPYPFKDKSTIQGVDESPNHPLFLKQPSNITTTVEYDPETKSYIQKEKIGEIDYRNPQVFDFKEYQDLDAKRSLHSYWKEKAKTTSGAKSDGIIPSIYIGGETFDRIFGGSKIDIRPSGSAELIFGVTSNFRDDPSLNSRQRRVTNFDFQEKIQMNVVAKVGDKIEFKANYNTESSFSFDNKLQLKYEGKEDEIIKLIEVGNVNLPLNSTLIQGSQSLFGIKSKLQFGRTSVTAVVSQQESQTTSIQVQGGAQTSKFKIKADAYEENKHFFMAQYFRDNYEKALAQLPIVASDINITKVEVWVTNIGAAVTDNRNIVAFQDMGEPDPYNPDILPIGGWNTLPSNKANTLFSSLDLNQVRNINGVSNYLKSRGYTASVDFEKVESARKLNSTEYSVNARLGFISLNTTINSDQTLAIAYQYTRSGDTTVYQVGEFSDGGVTAPSALMVKLLKSTSLNPRIPIWKLMMKNVYAIGSYQINSSDFILNILYSGSNNGVPTGYINAGRIAGLPLLQVMNLDNLDAQLNRILIDTTLVTDGIFDFIDGAALNGGTINSSNGRVYFPVLEPFGSHLRKMLGNDQLADQYCYDSLYTLTKVGAQQYPDKNKFILEGSYKSSSSSEISLNAINVPQGSVKVTMGGVPLTENVDYTVDYTLGRVKIINEALLASGTPINISLESNSMFSIQSKTYLGLHVDHQINKDFVVGATVINLTERPLTQKTIIGDDPISNTLWGMNLSWQQESQWLTRMIDKLPGIETKAPSKVSVVAEFAHFIPGHSKAIGSEGTSYVDDFEGSQTKIDLNQPFSWYMASTPQGQTEQGMFPEAAQGTGLAYGFNRAKLSWYRVSEDFYTRSGGNRPTNISKDEVSQNAVRQVLQQELFPNKDLNNNINTSVNVMNLHFLPSMRGPYNYDVAAVPGLSYGVAANGELNEPQSRWGGIMRKMESTDFEATNVEYIEFWMMDPFADDPNNPGGDVYFNLGEISEDILRDGRKSFENGLPTTATPVDIDTTVWGRVPKLQSLVNAFDNNADARQYQDVGYEGLRDEDERTFFQTNFLERIASLHGAGSEAYASAFDDPSSDNFHFFFGSDYDGDSKYSSILERYVKYNGAEGNSPISDGTTNYSARYSDLPNVEDINQDNTLSEDERYFQYKLTLRPDQMENGENFIADQRLASSGTLENGTVSKVKWYQFKIPVSEFTKVVGNIKDFKSIRFMRMYFKNWQKPVVVRLASLDLVRGEWRRYKYELLAGGEYIPIDDQSSTKFELSSVNVEENSSRSPVPYKIPPGIEQEINYGTTNYTRLNEQAMVLRIKELQDGDARAAYKTTGFDFRQYKRMKMFVHAENIETMPANNYGDLTIFIRLGADFTENYYEYEIPLSFTPFSTTNADDIWPESNRFDINLEKLVSLKLDRNTEIRDVTSGTTTSSPYVVYDGKNKITILGSPSLSDVKAIMIGIRNPKRSSLQSADDGNAKSAEIWVNELRLTDFVDQQGWAATTRFTATLADLGNIAIAGSHSTPGFGSIEQKTNERQKDAITNFDLSTNLQLGKFFPDDLGIKIPLHVDYSTAISNPQYNPLDPDVKLSDALDSYRTSAEKDSIKRIAQDYVQRTNISLLNVRKERVGTTQKPMPWDIENFDISGTYSTTKKRNIDLEYDNKLQYRAGFGYNYSIQAPNIKPFSRFGLIQKGKAFQLLRDFNFYPLPRMFAFRTELNREYTERKLRIKSEGDIILPATYLKSFLWTRNYDFKYDLATSLKLEYNAIASAVVDERPGSVDHDDYGYTAQEKRDYLLKQLGSFGRMNRYTQQVNVNYTIPINKLPYLDFLNATARYQGGYTWSATPLSQQEILGNTAENTNTIQINGTVKFVTLYNQIPYLKRLNQNQKTTLNRKPGAPKPGQNKPQPNVANNDSTNKKPSVDYLKIIGEGAIRFAMMVRDATISYSEQNGTLMPGLTPEPTYLGNNFSASTPGLGFVFGIQDDDLRYRAAQNGWITQDTLFNGQYMTKYTTNLNFRATLEPFKDLKIDLTANRTMSKDHSEYFQSVNGYYESTSVIDRGSFTMSYMTIGTAFSGVNDDNSSSVFDDFKNYRLAIAQRLAAANPNYGNTIVDSTGFPTGYGPTSQEVLHYAFLAAYTGKSPGKVSLNPFPSIPIPNWRVTYKGLMSLEFFKDNFKDVTISHGYRSSYNVSSYATNVLYKELNDAPAILDDANNYIPQYQMTQISISEQFVPLVGVDVTWKNSILTRAEYRQTRNLALSFSNNQITEVTSKEFVIGLGYRIKDLQVSFGGGGNSKYKSDLNLKVDFSIKDNKTILRRIAEELNQISAGTNVITLNTSADYQLNQRLSIKFFFDKTINKPHVSNQYNNSTTKGGISLRFTLAQ